MSGRMVLCTVMVMVVCLLIAQPVIAETSSCPDLVLHRAWVSTNQASSGDTVSIFYELTNSGTTSVEVTLTATFDGADVSTLLDPLNSETVEFSHGISVKFFRSFRIPDSAISGSYSLNASVATGIPCALTVATVQDALVVSGIAADGRSLSDEGGFKTYFRIGDAFETLRAILGEVDTRFVSILERTDEGWKPAKDAEYSSPQESTASNPLSPGNMGTLGVILYDKSRQVDEELDRLGDAFPLPPRVSVISTTYEDDQCRVLVKVESQTILRDLFSSSALAYKRDGAGAAWYDVEVVASEGLEPFDCAGILPPGTSRICELVFTSDGGYAELAFAMNDDTLRAAALDWSQLIGVPGAGVIEIVRRISQQESWGGKFLTELIEEAIEELIGTTAFWALLKGPVFLANLEVVKLDMAVYIYAQSRDAPRYRVEANHPPIAIARIYPGTTVAVGTTVLLDASGSYDPEKEELSYHWRGDQDADVALLSSSTEPVVEFTPTSKGYYQFFLVVADSVWESQEVFVGVEVVDRRQLAAPHPLVPGTELPPGQTIGDLTPTLTWEATEGATSYDVAISDSPYEPENIVLNPQGFTGTSYAVPEGILKPGTKYRWNLQAIRGDELSSVSSTLYFQTPDDTTDPAPGPDPGPDPNPAPDLIESEFHVYETTWGYPQVVDATVTASDGVGRRVSGVTASDGNVSLRGAPGLWRMTVAKEGYYGYSWNDAYSASGMHEVTLERVAEEVSVMGISIDGPDWLYEGASTVYYCVASFSNGRNGRIDGPINWSLNTSNATVSADGQMTAGDLPNDLSCVLTAIYTVGINQWTATRTVHLRDTPQEEEINLTTVSFTVTSQSWGRLPLDEVTVRGRDGADHAFEATTNSQGNVVITGAWGAWQVSFSKEGYEEYYRPFSFEGTSEHDASVTLAQTQEGAIYLDMHVHENLPSGPLAASILVEGRDEGGHLFEGVTDENGYIRISGIQGTWEFWLSAEGYHDKNWIQPVTGEEPLHGYIVVFDSPGIVYPEVHLYEDVLGGLPVDGVRVWGTISRDEDADITFEGVTDANGIVSFEGPMGVWSFNASRDGYAAAEWSEEYWEWSPRETEQALEKYWTHYAINLYVHSESLSGLLIQDALIEGHDGQGNEFIGYRTNASGYRSMNGVEGLWLIRVSRPGYQTLEWEQEVLADDFAQHIALLPIGWPEVPTGLLASNDECSQVSLSWDSSPSADSYDVFRSLSAADGYGQLDSTTSASYTDSTVSSANVYYYKIRSNNSAGSSELSSEVLGHLALQIATPTGFYASDDEDYQVTMSWDPVEGATEYRILRSSTLEGPYSHHLLATTLSSVIWTGGDPGVTCYYKVVTVGECGFGVPSEYDAGTPIGFKPDKPTGVNASDSEYCDKVVISWDPVPGATFYQVNRVAETSEGMWNLSVAAAITTAEDITATPGTESEYRVRACNEGWCSDFSARDIGQRMTPPAPPSGVQASDGGVDGDIAVTWNAGDGASSYEVYRATSSTEAYFKIGESETTNFTDSQTDVGVNYYYQIVACNECGCSDPSARDLGYVSGLTAPEDLRVTNFTCDMFEIYWEPVRWAQSYEVFRGTSPTGEFEYIIGNTPTRFQEFASTERHGAIPGVTYYYMIRAVSVSLVPSRGPFSEIVSGMVAGPIPGTPTGLQATDGQWGDRIDLEWDTASYGTRYTISISETSDGRYSDTFSTTSTSYVHQGVPAGIVYYYRVRAYNDCGGGCLFGPTSDYDSGYAGEL